MIFAAIFTHILPNLDFFNAIWQIIIDFCIIFAVAKSKSYDNR